MPRKALFTKEEIIKKSFEIIRQHGPQALTARSLAAALGSSPRPIFTIFNTMDEIRAEVRYKAQAFFDNYVADIFDYTPAFKEFGIRLIKFAQKEEQLFRLLFLNKETPNDPLNNVTERCTQSMAEAYNISLEQSHCLLTQCWTYVCGLALIMNNQAARYTDDEINELLSRQFLSTLFYLKSEYEVKGIAPRKRTSEDDSPVLEVPFK